MNCKTVIINEVEYVPAEPSADRAVVVVDRGWIFAGDVREEGGRIHLSRAIWVFRWEEVGFDGVIANPTDKRVKLRKIDDVDIPAGAEVFRVPVSADWGL